MLVDYALRLCREKGYSSWHCNFVIEDDYSPLAQQPLLRRRDWQFHWRNKEYGCFDDFLADLRSRKRKSIRRERRQVQQAGIQVQWKSGLEIDDADLDFVYDCYIGTFHNYGNYPALKKRFFEIIGQELGEGFQIALASRDEQHVAAAVFLAGGGRLYGRYWGCMEDVPGLHFELAYYQGIDFCIRNGLQVFESGAQGEHKIARGFLPTRTRSFHHIEHPGFRQAIDEHLQREKSWLDEYRHQLDALSPFRRDDT